MEGREQSYACVILHVVAVWIQRLSGVQTHLYAPYLEAQESVMRLLGNLT